MVPEIAKTLLEFLKLTPRFLTALGVASALLLFSSDELLARLGLAEFVQKWRFALGLALVMAISLLGVHASANLLESARRFWRQRRSDKHIIERLHRLTEDEKQILRYYIKCETRANMLRIESGVVQELVKEGIIWKSTSMGNVLEGFAHNISDIAWDYLHLHPEFLDGATDIAYTDKRRHRYGD